MVRERLEEVLVTCMGFVNYYRMLDAGRWVVITLLSVKVGFVGVLATRR
jgi:hypothetical protein